MFCNPAAPAGLAAVRWVFSSFELGIMDVISWNINMYKCSVVSYCYYEST